MLDSNQSGTWKQTEPNKTAKESLSRPSRYFWICIDIYIHFFTSQVSFLIHTLRHSSDQCFRCAVIHPSRLQFAVPPTNRSCCHRQLTTQISPSSFNRNAPPSSFHLAPRLHLLHLLHLPSAITHSPTPSACSLSWARSYLPPAFNTFSILPRVEERVPVSDHVRVF